MKYQKGFAAIEVVYVGYFIVTVAGAIGWVMNIIDIVNSDFDHITGMLVLRVIGVFLAPLGAVLGYF